MYFKALARYSIACALVALPAVPAVAKAPTRTRLIAISPAPVGQAVTLTAEVDTPAGGAPTGTASFTEGDTVLGSAPLSVFGAGQATLTTGLAHTCALASPAGVHCWGWNRYGQLGDGSTSDHFTPVPVTGLSARAVELAAGGSHSCALTINGAVECWGDNSWRQLGDSSARVRSTPAPVPGLTSGVVAIAAGSAHSCAVTIAGGVMCWGRNAEGQLGIGGDPAFYAPPTRIGGPAKIYKAVAAGQLHSCGLTNTGAVLCWGEGFGALPVPIAGAQSGIVAVTAGVDHSCAITKAGAVKCWRGPWTASSSAKLVSGLSSRVVAITSGRSHDCALLIDGGVRCWGSNRFGQLGDGTTAHHLATPRPVVNLGGPAVAIAAGWDYTCALLSSRAAKCWGYNEVGEIGDGSTTNRSLPAPVTGFSAILRGRARFATSTLGAGCHSLRANYLGDATHTASRSGAVCQRMQ
ncbi:chromosome condensation regulator RCC1 [Methylosinus sp. Sm6]|uniref:RCC1 domain-containing protein n=1 Tax=Methylosinus sp. Sm6 TaxID=2866948 RepID=UPI001C990CC6|nr:chromosome condensation regulator RCC1 [Methylosinus sp. Sm6]MBY6241848.1 chromosome condensation regulator RCC1 [Methylosinus sp. Sm6]